MEHNCIRNITTQPARATARTLITVAYIYLYVYLTHPNHVPHTWSLSLPLTLDFLFHSHALLNNGNIF